MLLKNVAKTSVNQFGVLAFVCGLLVAFSQMAAAQTESILHNFKGYPKDGQTPYIGTLVRATATTMYGTTENGGAHSGGSVYRLTFPKTGGVTEKLIYSFTYSDGKSPYGGVIRYKGILYGTTAGGGGSGYGTVFKITIVKGVVTETVLHSFSGPPGGGGTADGAFPYAGLVVDSSGNYYGTTTQGGTFGFGTVFKITSAGAYSVLYNFQGAPDGASPVAGLVLDAAGNLYGTTASGGAYSNSGTVYKITTGGAYTKLHDIDIYTGEGAAPWGGVVLDAAGNLYGTTNSTVFELTAGGVYSVLWTLGTHSGDGSGSFAGLVRDAAGNLYGTTLYGGTSGLGTVFEVTGPGAETVLYSFGGTPDGEYPEAGLVRDSSGNLFGTTTNGGSSSMGTVFCFGTSCP